MMVGNLRERERAYATCTARPWKVGHQDGCVIEGNFVDGCLVHGTVGEPYVDGGKATYPSGGGKRHREGDNYTQPDADGGNWLNDSLIAAQQPNEGPPSLDSVAGTLNRLVALLFTDRASLTAECDDLYTRRLQALQ